MNEHINITIHIFRHQWGKTGNPLVTVNEQAIYYTFPLFEMYKTQGVKAYKELILAGVDHLLNGEKLLKSELPTTADTVVNHQPEEKRIVLNVLHYIPERRAITVDTIEEKFHYTIKRSNWTY
ncbi:hypothetical protein GQR36_09390 [Enterococcus termitis]